LSSGKTGFLEKLIHWTRRTTRAWNEAGNHEARRRERQRQEESGTREIRKKETRKPGRRGTRELIERNHGGRRGFRGCFVSKNGDI
jgi:hypothetical protein